MKSISLAGWALAGFLMLAGCSSVTTLHPVGNPVDDEKAKKLDGTWLADDSVFFLKYQAKGKLQIAGVDWKEDRFELNTLNGFLGEDEGIYYLSVTNGEKDQSPTRYTFLRLTMPNDRTLVAYLPQNDAFEQAVKKGRLAGKVQEGEHSTTVNLEASKKQVDEFITPKQAAEQFDLNSPVVFKRLGKAE